MSWIIFDTAIRRQSYAKTQELKLAEAIAKNDLETASQLLKRGVNPNVRIVGQASEPLIFLVFEKHWFTLPIAKIGDRPKSLYRIVAKEECLHLLLKFGADPNVKNSLGQTILELAILWCLPETVKLLLMNGADPNIRSQKGLTPLMKATIFGIQDARPMQDKLKIMIYLLDSGAEIDAQTPEGKTALMYAVGNARIEVVELLVSSGASLDITDNQGNQARDVVSQGINSQSRTYLNKILSQPQLNVIKYKYQQFIPEGDRLLARIINRRNGDDDCFSDDIPRKF